MPFLGSGRRGGLARLVAILLTVPAAQSALCQSQNARATKAAAAHRTNELTLAGLTPGRGTIAQARQLYRKIDPHSVTHDAQIVWQDPCRGQSLAMDFDSDHKIQVIRTTQIAVADNCVAAQAALPSPWKTGHGLRIGDSASKALRIYGEPDSRSPSTKGGQPLELWYYAFDWAGADVPQVMEIVCTREVEGHASQVTEITLAAPSL
jgi:hypothetical protein